MLTQSPRYDFEPFIHRRPVRFPKGERLAILIYVNIEHAPFGTKAAAHAIYPGTMQFSPDVLNHGWRDYGNRVGLWRIVDAMDRHGFRGTVNLNSDVCREYPQIIREGNDRNWEWGAQGDRNGSVPSLMSEDEERDFIHLNLGIIEEATGKRPKGWLSWALAESFVTPDLLAEAGIEYVSNYAHDELPVPMRVKRGSLITMPYQGSIRCPVRGGQEPSPHHVDLRAPVHLGSSLPHEASRKGPWLYREPRGSMADDRRRNQ
jgi:hypothetical protein